MARDEDWWAIARGSSDAARALQRSPATYRSSVSRHYYAAYQAVTALLIARGRTLPKDEEAWSHLTTSEMLSEELRASGHTDEARRKWRDDLKDLYRARLVADYSARLYVGEADVIQASERSRGIIDLVSDLRSKGGS